MPLLESVLFYPKKLGASFGGFYKCTLRNEKKFGLGDNVFFSTSRYQCEYERALLLMRGQICGVYMTDDENPEYTYDVKILSDLNTDAVFLERKGDIIKGLFCDTIFSSVEEAEQSALSAGKGWYEDYLSAVERFFKDFKETVT